jgi:hypothetical protein
MDGAESALRMTLLPIADSPKLFARKTQTLKQRASPDFSQTRHISLFACWAIERVELLLYVECDQDNETRFTTSFI